MRHVVDHRLIVAPGAELRREPRGGQLLKKHCATRRVSGRFPCPIGARGREGLKVREVGKQPVEDGQHFFAIFDPDVHVDAPDHQLATPPLGAIDEGRIPFVLGHFLREPLAERMRARAHEVDAAGLGNCAYHVDGGFEVDHGIRHPVVHTGDDFNGVGEEFTGDARVLRPVRKGQAFQDVGGRRRQFSAGMVDEREFPFDPEGGALGFAKIDLHATPSVLQPRCCVQLSNHAIACRVRRAIGQSVLSAMRSSHSPSSSRSSGVSAVTCPSTARSVAAAAIALDGA